MQDAQRCGKEILVCGRVWWLTGKLLGMPYAMRGSSPVYITSKAESGHAYVAQVSHRHNNLTESTMPTSDFGVMRPLDGYPSLAEDIASDPDRTSLVFRRFDKLAVRNLLYLQSELVEVEAMQVRTRSVRIL